MFIYLSYLSKYLTYLESTPPKRTPSSSEIERCRTSAGRTLPSRPLSPISTNIKPVPARRGLSPATTNASPRGVSTKIEPAAGGKGPKKDVASKIASLWKKVSVYIFIYPTFYSINFEKQTLM